MTSENKKEKKGWFDRTKNSLTDMYNGLEDSLGINLPGNNRTPKPNEKDYGIILKTLMKIPILGAVISFFMKLGELWDEYVKPLFGDNKDLEVAHKGGDANRRAALEENKDKQDPAQRNNPAAQQQRQR